MNVRFGKFYGDEWIRLPAEVIRLLPRADEADLRILLAAAPLLNAGAVSEEEVAAALDSEFSPSQVASALAFWRGAGVLSSASARQASARKDPEPEKTEEARRIDAEEAPFYTAGELAEAREKDAGFAALTKFAEKKLGKVLNTSETARLYTFLDYMKLPAEVVMLSIEDCCARGKNSLRYVSKQLNDFADSGVDTYEKAEAFFAKRNRFDEYSRRIRDLFGIGDRAFTAKEKEAIEKWQKWEFGPDMLTLAFEKTVSSAKKPTIAYMHKILEGWFRDGWLTPADVEKGKAADRPAKTYDLDDFFEAAVERTRRKSKNDNAQ